LFALAVEFLSALAFASAEFHAGSPEKVAQYLACIREDDIEVLIFKTIYALHCNEHVQAAQLVERGFAKITALRAVFNGSDTNEASKHMLYAQHLVELHEVIDMRAKGVKVLPEIWRNRLKTFRHDGDAWRRLMEIRSLVLSPTKTARVI
jgi:hypothetical protein